VGAGGSSCVNLRFSVSWSIKTLVTLERCLVKHSRASSEARVDFRNFLSINAVVVGGDSVIGFESYCRLPLTEEWGVPRLWVVHVRGIRLVTRSGLWLVVEYPDCELKNDQRPSPEDPRGMGPFHTSRAAQALYSSPGFPARR
jgi:hypothetical protein